MTELLAYALVAGWVRPGSLESITATSNRLLQAVIVPGGRDVIAIKRQGDGASKGFLTTTSDFAPLLRKDPLSFHSYHPGLN